MHAGNTRSLAQTLLSRVMPALGRKVYLLDFAAYTPGDECVPCLGQSLWWGHRSLHHI